MASTSAREATLQAIAAELTAAQDVVTCVGAPKPEAIAVAQQGVIDARRRVATLQEISTLSTASPKVTDAACGGDDD